jgi:uncharacterized protein with PIN domain
MINYYSNFHCEKCGAKLIKTTTEKLIDGFNPKTGEQNKLILYHEICLNKKHWWDGHWKNDWEKGSGVWM